MLAGACAEDTVKFLTNADDGRDHRQLHVMDREGRFAAYTGKACIDCGDRIRSTFSVACGMLAGRNTIGRGTATLSIGSDTVSGIVGG